MKKFLAIFALTAVIAVGCFAGFTAQANVAPIRVVINGRAITTEVPPVVQNGRTLVPFRAIFEALGAQVEWTERTNTVAGYRGPNFVLLQPGMTRAWITGRETRLDVGPVIVSGRTMVPLRFVAESLGAQVEWVEATRTVTITDIPYPAVPTVGRTGGEFRTLYSAELTTLNYLTTGTFAVHTLVANAIDGLVEFDTFGVLQPSLAKHWTISPDGLVYTFTLREGVPWLTWDGREYAEVVAQDFVDSARYVLTRANASATANIVFRFIRGAEEFFNGTTTDFSTVGVRALDRYTVQYTLKAPATFFLSALTYVCFFPVNGAFLAETGARFATDHRTFLSNGAYILRAHVPQNRRELVKNTRYWDSDNVHIDRLFFQFNREAAQLAPEMFVRGEVSSASIPTAIIDGWRLDPTRRDLIRPAPVGAFAFWHGFNFDPRFAAQFEPENWRRAVRNLNFRKTIFHGLDRVAAMLTFDPFDPTRQLSNTITPVNFISVDGVDYTELPALRAVQEMTVFSQALALTHRNRALSELRAQGVTFPIKVKMPFSTGSPDWTNRVQVIKQQMENLLGRDFIEIIPVGYPPTGFLDATRRAGNYALQEVNWGPDFLDPEAYTMPFEAGNRSYSDIALVDTNYQRLLDAAKAEVSNKRRRFELFAAAEAYLIQNALVIPYRVGGGGYVASLLHPFQGPFAAAGPSTGKFKFQRLLERPMNIAQFNEAQLIWNRDRVAALRKAGQ